MNHSFDIAIAKKYGVSEAIFIENLRFWILRNKANKKHFYEGRYWTYNSAKAYTELFPYWSKQQIERIVMRLKDAGVIEIGHFSSNKYDRTNWYSFNDPVLFLQSGSIEFDESTNTDIKPDNTVALQEVPIKFDEFWKLYPRKTNKSFAIKCFSKVKPNQELMLTIMNALRKQIPLWKDPLFIPHASTWLNNKRWEDEEASTTKADKFAGAY